MRNLTEEKSLELSPEFVNLFAVEELEERMEFAKWSGEVSGDNHGTVTGTIKVEF